jgi:large subunit ribosomal protein L24
VKRENEISMPYDDVRLVAPYTVTDIDSNGQKFERVADVIVDKVDMEEHTSGKNLFTGEEDDWNISEDQRVDPETDQKIYHRYIAGTRTVIEWPWQQDKPAEDGQEKPKTNEDDSQGIMQKSLKSLQSLLPSGKAKEAKRIAAQEDQQKKREQMAEQQREARKNILAKPREKDPREYEDDTPRNVVEINEMDMDNAGLFRPTLLYPTMPVSIITELRDLRAKEVDEKAIDKDERIEQLRAQRRERVQKEKEQIAARIASMKTPMQIRRDLEQAKKQKHDLAAPTAPSEALLRVLGKQMDKNERLRKEIKVSRAEGLARMEQERTRMQEEKAAKKAHVQEAIAEKRARIQKAAEERTRMREVKGRQVWKGRHEAKAVHELNV